MTTERGKGKVRRTSEKSTKTGVSGGTKIGENLGGLWWSWTVARTIVKA
jgi:hypothetical protein